MPVYDYTCPACGPFESRQVRDATCPLCGAKGKRRFGAAVLYHPTRTEKGRRKK